MSFKIKRVFWIYDVPGDEVRWGTHRESEEFIVALSGSFDDILHDAKTEQRMHLKRSYNGICAPRMIWRSLDNFSTNLLALILSSTNYSQADHIRDFDQFKKAARR